LNESLLLSRHYKHVQVGGFPYVHLDQTYLVKANLMKGMVGLNRWVVCWAALLYLLKVDSQTSFVRSFVCLCFVPLFSDVRFRTGLEQQ